MAHKLDKAMKLLLNEHDGGQLLNDVELRLNQCLVGIEQEEKTLTSLSNTDQDISLASELITNLLKQTEAAEIKLNLNIDNCSNHLIENALQTSAEVSHWENTLRGLDSNFEQAGNLFSDQTLTADITALSGSNNDGEQEVVLRGQTVCECQVTLEEIASAYPTNGWIPQFNDLNEDNIQIMQVCRVSEDEISKLDEDLQQLMRESNYFEIPPKFL